MRALPPVQTGIGDVLILQTSKTFVTYAVGLVTVEGQQDFCGQMATVAHLGERDAVVSRAEWLVAPGRRILLHDIDTGVWSEILYRKEPRSPRGTRLSRRQPPQALSGRPGQLRSLATGASR